MPNTQPIPESPVQATVPDPSVKPERVQDGPGEIGGRDGPDPTRYGDWEKNGRCIDF